MAAPTNRLRRALAAGRFAVMVEVVTPERRQPLDTALGPALALARAVAGDGRVAGLSVTDRVRSDDDHDPVAVGVALALASGATPLVHLSGKDRGPGDLARSLGGLAAAGIDNVLCVTGDRLKAPPASRPVPYVDSVDAVRLARRLLPGALVAAAVSPFKYTEEETHNQYFKMARKHEAGADCLITQVGWDMDKLAELARYRAARGLAQPVLANLMTLPVGAARYLHRGAVPGVVVTDDLLALVEAESRAPDRGRAAWLDRLALQVVGAERLGYAGAQLSGLSGRDEVSRALDLVDGWSARLGTEDDWRQAWREQLRLPGGRPARLGPPGGYALFGGGDGGRAAALPALARGRYLALRAAHRLAFDPASPLARALRLALGRVPAGSRTAAWLAALVRAVKGPLLGCQMCGECRLPSTFYVCPETCPKGLASGPCGGSRDNRCEAGDRECIHATTYRLARAAGRLGDLEHGLVPPARGRRGESSWLAYFADPGPATAAAVERSAPVGPAPDRGPDRRDGR